MPKHRVVPRGTCFEAPDPARTHTDAPTRARRVGPLAALVVEPDNVVPGLLLPDTALFKPFGLSQLPEMVRGCSDDLDGKRNRYSAGCFSTEHRARVCWLTLGPAGVLLGG